MSIWKPSGVDEEPAIELYQWKAFSVPLPGREHRTTHLVGSRKYDGEGYHRLSLNLIKKL